MIAGRLHAVGEELRLDHVHIPRIGPEDVLVKVSASGVCHSDINYIRGIAPVGRLPITLGHEIAGVVAKTGRRVRGIKQGERVCVHYVVHCGRCKFCRTGKENYCTKYRMMGKDVDGGFAEYVSVPANSIVRLPGAIPFEQGAIMGCAVSTAFHALNRGRTQRGDHVVVFGVGGLGAHAIQLASKIFKSASVTAVDLLEAKLVLAKMLGATAVVNGSERDPVETVRRTTDGRLADVVIDFVGQERTMEKAVECVGKGGRMVLVGIGARQMRLQPYRMIIGKEMEIVGVNDHLKTELVQLVKMVDSGRIDLSKSVTHRVSLEEINSGIHILEENLGNPVRVVVTES